MDGGAERRDRTDKSVAEDWKRIARRKENSA